MIRIVRMLMISLPSMVIIEHLGTISRLLYTCVEAFRQVSPTSE